ncbi:MAG TPA: amylo-alpha-1,6-glucosidase [Terriglobia bacterium]|nr:amylo-alpha-1,6-glucosidase [Terriglobia bacterium]
MPLGNSAEEVIRIDEHCYILATSSLADSRTHVLKHADTFAVFDRHGDIQPVGRGVQGLYHQETRFLSRLVLKLEGERPILLSSSIKRDNALLAAHLTNCDILDEDRVAVPHGDLHFDREKFLWQGTCYERITITNYARSEVSVSMSLEFEADYADLFEVRGTRRKARGRLLDPQLDKDEVILAYEGLDNVLRKTRIRCSPLPTCVRPGELRFEVALQPRSRGVLAVSICCESGNGTDQPQQESTSFSTAFSRVENSLKKARSNECEIYTSNEQFNDWLIRASADLRMLVTDLPQGPYPFAGVPWFNTVFGRDGIITAFEMLWSEPDLARCVLAYLAATQATESDARSDAEPGKIIHEMRNGEMAALGEVPFARYYGSVDATPLFVVLAGAYLERTGDRSFIESIWPSIELAVRWIDDYGDLDGDGFVEYQRRSGKGLDHQGWKDSQDSVFHANGALAEPPIALCEVQGYVYAARLRAAEIAETLGRRQRAAVLRADAARLRDNFEALFWCEVLSTYALALDGRKQPCRVRTSNAGQCLFTGIASAEHARRAAATLLQADMFTGWGIRTVSSNELRYNPMSYHNGSVWPHDNALISCGMSRYGLGESAARVFSGMFDTVVSMELHHLPELICGLDRRPGEAPTLYPVACLPQAWSAASVFMLLGACLGISITASPPRVCFTRAYLPETIPEVQIRNLKVAQASVDLFVSRSGDHFSVKVLRRKGKVEIVTSQ